MPIYAYKCETCGHSKDVLQKMSDTPLVDCPSCGAATFKKQLTAAGFQLKGSGWYVTDFRDGKGGADKPKDGEKSKESGDSEKSETASGGASDAATKPASSNASNASNASAPVSTPAPAPAATASPAPGPAPKAAT